MCTGRADHRDSQIGKGVGVGHVVRFWICSEGELSRMGWIGPGGGKGKGEGERATVEYDSRMEKVLCFTGGAGLGATQKVSPS